MKGGKVMIGECIIGRDEPVFVIAESGINHNGDMALAKRLVDAAKSAGADAVKFQTFVPEEEVTAKLQKVSYQKSDPEDKESYLDMLKKLQFTETQWRALMSYCEESGIIFLSTPSEETSAELLHKLDVPAYKIGSNDLVTLPMLEEIAAWGKPMLLSTGMADMNEIREALASVNAAGNSDVVLLQCTSSYPAALSDLNLRIIETFKNEFGCLVGFSDHSEGIDAAPLSVLLGAAVIEKHLTLDKTLPGPDQALALEPDEFARMVQSIRGVEGLDEKARADKIAKTPDAEVMLGKGEKSPTPDEIKMRIATRKSIVARRAIKAGEIITRDVLAFKRPCEGLPARVYKDVIGRRALSDIAPDEFVTMENIAQ